MASRGEDDLPTTSPHVTLLRQIQHGFTLVGFLFVFAGVGGFLFMLITHAQIDRLFPLAFLTALLEGLGMFACAIGLEMVLSFAARRHRKSGGRR